MEKNKLDQDRTLFKSIINDGDYAAFSKTVDGVISAWSSGAEKLFGYSSEEIIGSSVSMLVPPHLKNEENALSQKVYQGQKVDYYETERLSKNGKVIPVLLVLSPVKNLTGDITGLAAIACELNKERKVSEGVQDSFRHTFDNMLEGAQIHDYNWRYIYVNDALVKYSHYSKEELIGYTVMEKYPGIEQTKLFKVMERCMNERVTERLETEFVYPDGTGAYFELSIQPIPEGIFILSIDATKRKLAEEKLELALAKAKESLFKIFNASPSGMVITAIDSRKFIEINKNFLTTFGYKREEVVGLTTTELGIVTVENSEKLATLFKKQGYLKNEAILAYTKDKKEIHCIVSVELFEMEGKEFLLSVFHDISRTKEMERKITESEQKFQKAFQASGAGVAITRLSDNTYQDVNEAFVEMTGYLKDELLGVSSADLNMVVNMDKREETLQKIRDYGSAKHVELTIRHKSGRIVEILSDIEVILIDDEKYAINVIYDITDRKKMEEQLRTVNKELEAFSYSVSHDLRAPLRAIDGYAKMLEEMYSKVLDQEGKRLLELVQHNTKKMSNLIDDLLSFSKQGKAPVHKVQLDMTELFKIALDDLGKTINNKAEVRLNKLHSAEGDYAMINQVVINLASNALKYSSKKQFPVIEISSVLENGEVIYSIKDNGDGFDMKYVDKLFGVFQRLHGSAEFEGTGVGLAIVQRIINKHGGRVWAEGEVGNGAIFSFTLPVCN